MLVDLQDLAFDQGGALLVKRALRAMADGETVDVAGSSPDLAIHLRAWCRAEGHPFPGMTITKGPAATQRWSCAERAGWRRRRGRSSAATMGTRRARSLG